MSLIEPRHEPAVRLWLADMRALNHGTGPGDASRAIAVERQLPRGAPSLLRAVLMSGRSTWEIASRQRQREAEIRQALARALYALTSAYAETESEPSPPAKVTAGAA